MTRYHVTRYSISPENRKTTVLVSTVQAPTAGQAISNAYPGVQATEAPDEDLAEWRGGPTRDGITVLIEAEPAQPSQYGALREAIATAATLERTLEQAIEQLARIAGIPQDTAYTCLLSIGKWIPGDPITDEQCRAFAENVENMEADPE